MDLTMNTNRIVLITGAAGGVGTVLVDRFVANGDTIIATDARQDVLDSWRTRWPGDAKIITAAADITSETDVEAITELVRDTAGHLDVLINCAGYFPIVGFEEMTTKQWRQVIDINLTGTFLMTHALLPLMKDQGSGRIINFSSASIYPGVPGQAHYVAAKAGVIGFTRSLAREVGNYGITVNNITPGLTVTQAVRDSFPAAILQSQRDGRALHRDEAPEDLVGPVFFLASEDAAFVTGQTLNVDGGMYMH
jgi:NAD(P)-dependent dehydrogenase (short-subunit alcohol dehydrogenase family)